MAPIDTLTTLNDLFCRVAAAANARAILWQDEFGQWQPVSSDQIYQRVRALAQAFLTWGAKKGDRIALISENRWEWAVTDFATMAIGAVNVPIYPTLTGEQIAALVSDAGCRIAVVSTRQQFDKLHAVRGQTSLERILMMDSGAPSEGAIPFSEAIGDFSSWVTLSTKFDCRRVRLMALIDRAKYITTPTTNRAMNVVPTDSAVQ